MRQDIRHGLGSDPLHEGGNLQDLLGLRVLGTGAVATVRRLLPRVDREHLERLSLEGLPGVPVTALSPEAELAEAGLQNLREAACSAACLRQLEGKHPVRVEAKAAALQAGRRFGSVAQVAELVGIGRTRAKELVGLKVDPRLITAILRQLHLRAHVAQVPTRRRSAPTSGPGPDETGQRSPAGASFGLIRPPASRVSAPSARSSPLDGRSTQELRVAGSDLIGVGSSGARAEGGWKRPTPSSTFLGTQHELRCPKKCE